MRAAAVRRVAVISTAALAVFASFVIAPATPPAGAESAFAPFVIDDTTPAAGQVITVSGEGCTAGKYVRLLVRQRFPDAYVDMHTIENMIPIAPDGTWVGHGMIRDDAQAGTPIEVAAWCKRNNSEPYPLATVTVSAPAAHPVQVLAVPAADPYRVGQSLTISGGGCEPGSEVYASISKSSRPFEAFATVRSDGTWTATGTIKKGDGHYVLSAKCGAPGLGAEDIELIFLRRFVVVRPAVASTTTTSTTSTPPTTTVPDGTPPPATPQAPNGSYTG